jgi:hypothetical protein
MMNNALIAVNKNLKVFRSRDYSYNFDMVSGYFQRWGKTLKDDPTFSPYSPEIADIEITTSCHGPRVYNRDANGVRINDGSATVRNRLCSFCYKSNTPNGKYMSFETFAKLLDKFPHVIDPKTGKRIFALTQIAFGVDAECNTNPDVWRIFAHCRDNGIIPNLTVASIDDEVAGNIANYCGACAVSRYSDKDVCYDTVDLLTNKHGMTQVNIHQLVSAATINDIWETLRDVKTDPRLAKLNAIVFLSLKQKGRGVTQSPMPQEEYAKIVQYCLANNISFGSDSCGAGKLLKSLDKEQYEKVIGVVEPCEAGGKFSFYCDVDAKYYPCSFMANEEGDWKDGIDMLAVNDFVKDVWTHPKTLAFRDKVDKCNECLGGCCHFKV